MWTRRTTLNAERYRPTKMLASFDFDVLNLEQVRKLLSPSAVPPPPTPLPDFCDASATDIHPHAAECSRRDATGALVWCFFPRLQLVIACSVVSAPLDKNLHSADYLHVTDCVVADLRPRLLVGFSFSRFASVCGTGSSRVRSRAACSCRTHRASSSPRLARSARVSMTPGVNNRRSRSARRNRLEPSGERSETGTPCPPSSRLSASFACPAWSVRKNSTRPFLDEAANLLARDSSTTASILIGDRRAMVLASSWSLQFGRCGAFRCSESRRRGPDRIRDVRRCEMAVVLFHHTRVGVAEVLRHDEQRHARHDGEGAQVCLRP